MTVFCLIQREMAGFSCSEPIWIAFPFVTVSIGRPSKQLALVAESLKLRGRYALERRF